MSTWRIGTPPSLTPLFLETVFNPGGEYITVLRAMKIWGRCCKRNWPGVGCPVGELCLPTCRREADRTAGPCGGTGLGKHAAGLVDQLRGGGGGGGDGGCHSHDADDHRDGDGDHRLPAAHRAHHDHRVCSQGLDPPPPPSTPPPSTPPNSLLFSPISIEISSYTQFSHKSKVRKALTDHRFCAAPPAYFLLWQPSPLPPRPSTMQPPFGG